MTVPWLEIEEVHDASPYPGRVDPKSAWQALFACQVQVPPHQEWARLKWGLNVAMLFEEAMERQKLFLESQYGYPDEHGMEARDHRTLAFRFINRPGEKLLVAVLGKIQGHSEQEVRENALSYYTEIQATFPYDYGLTPAISQDDFFFFSGMDILQDENPALDVAQISRMEFPIHPKASLPYLQGSWRSGPRAHEQIWRAVSACPSALFLNICLRSTVLYEDEQKGLLKNAADLSNVDVELLNPISSSALKQWNKDILARRLAPWQKFFYLQVHLVSTQTISSHLVRTIGTSLTLNNKGSPLPGYQVTLPTGTEEIRSWKNKIKNLNVILSQSYLQCPRLSEVADLNEVFDVIQIPYSPPDNGFPGLNFATSKEKMGHQDG